MRKFKLEVSPLFWVLAVVMVVLGRGMTMAAYVFSLVLHELAHASVAARYGYKLSRIRLAPYGAMLSGDGANLCAKTEIKVALAGPICSIVLASLCFCASKIAQPLAIFFAPITEANLCLGVCNLIPVYPLDGGRALVAMLACRMHTVKAKRWASAIGIVVACVFVLVASASVFFGASISIAVFAVFAMLGAWTSAKGASYVALLDATSLRTGLLHGIPVACYAVDEGMTVAHALRLADGKRLCVFALCNARLGLERIVSEVELRRAVEELPASATLGQAYAKLHGIDKA